MDGHAVTNAAAGEEARGLVWGQVRGGPGLHVEAAIEESLSTSVCLLL